MTTSGYPFKYNFRPQKRGDDFLGIKFNFVDGAGDPLDLTNCTAKMQLRRTPGNKIVLEWSTEALNIDVVTNQVYIKQRTGDEMDIEEYKYFYDLQVTYPDGVRWTAIEGLFPILNDITR